jgi:sugar/nucleoside kinase (ribokinase family)
MVNSYDVITFGSATWDIYLSPTNFCIIPSDKFISGKAVAFNLGSKVNLEHTQFSLGGGGVNTAFTFKNQGFKVAYLGCLGNDSLGREIIARLKKNKIGTKLIQTTLKASTNCSIVFNIEGEDRTIMVYRGASEYLSKINFKKAKWYYLAPLSGKIANLTQDIIDYAHKKNIQIAFNPGNSQLNLSKEVLQKMINKTNVLILNKENSAYETDLFSDLIKEIEKHATLKYKDDKIAYRIIADHLRGSSFLIGENILPSNTERGYILRRLLRRIIRYARIIDLDLNSIDRLIKVIILKYHHIYPELNQENIVNIFNIEKQKFARTLEKGLKEIEKLTEITPRQAFFLYQTFGFPIEMIKEEANKKGIEIDEKGFKEELKKHQEISRKGAEKKFGKNASEKEIKLHTATHLMHQALRDVLGESVQQMGSSINNERLRFDFSYTKKLSQEQIKEIEDIVNQRIKNGFKVIKEEMSLEKALATGALAFFKEKYKEVVNVYTIKNNNEIYSKEICAGPHIKSSENLGTFKILKESSSGANTRRIRAVIN